jgi:AI-2 transport protein TqsA
MSESPQTTLENKNKYWITGSGVQTLSLAVLAAIGIAFALSLTKSMMIPFVLSLFLYFILSPIRTFFVRYLKLPNWLALVATFTVVALLLTLVFFILFSAFQEFALGYRDYEARVIYFADTVQQFLIDRGLPLESMDFSMMLRKLPFTQLAKGAGASFLSLVSTTLLVFVFLIFLFTGGSARAKNKKSSSIGKEIDSQIRKYLGVKLITSSVTAAIVFVIFTALGLDLAFVFGFLVFLLNFIPTVGSFFATLLPLPVAFVQYDSFTPVVLVLVLPGLVQFIIGNIIEPRVMGQSLNIHPVAVLLSLMFWSLIWGIVGAFLAVPITAVIKIALQKVEGGNFVAQLLSGNFEEPKG